MAYASKYYDPVKAHEYYMKNRKLKGRRSSKGMSQSQKEQWAYAKNQLSEEEKLEKQQASAENMASRKEQKEAISSQASFKKEVVSARSKIEKERIVAQGQNMNGSSFPSKRSYLSKDQARTQDFLTADSVCTEPVLLLPASTCRQSSTNNQAQLQKKNSASCLFRAEIVFSLRIKLFKGSLLFKQCYV